MRSLRGLWVGGAEVPFCRFRVQCFWMSGPAGGAGGAGFLWNLTHLPVKDMNAKKQLKSALTGVNFKCKVVKYVVKTMAAKYIEVDAFRRVSGPQKEGLEQPPGKTSGGI